MLFEVAQRQGAVAVAQPGRRETLYTLGALGGLAFAHWGGRLLVRQLSTSTNTVFLDLGMDWRVLAFTASATVLTAVLFGTRAPRRNPRSAAPR